MTLNRNIAKDSVKTTTVTFLVQAVSFVISAVIAALYGATGNTDAYFYALSFVLIITTGTTGILKAVFIPVFLRFKKESPEKEREILGSFYFVFSLFLFSIWLLFVLLGFFLTSVSHLSLGGIEPALLGKLLFQMSFLIILTGFVECYSTVYNSYQKFIVPLITPIVRSGIFIGFVFLTRSFLGVQSLSIGNIVGEAFQLVLLTITLYLTKIPLSFKFSLHKAIRRMIKNSAAPFLSNAMTRINALVDNTFIAPLLVGGVTILNYSSKIAGIPETLLTGSFLTVIFSYWSLSRAEDGMEKVGDSLKKVLMILGFIFIPILSFMYFLRLPLVQLMYERSNFTYELSLNTARFLGFYLIGILPLILGRVLTRAFLVMEDTWTPFWVGNLRFILKVVMNIIFIKLVGYIGIPISSTVTSFIMFFYMYVVLRRKIGISSHYEILIEYIKMILAGVFSGFAVLLLYRYIAGMMGAMFTGKLFSVSLSCFVGLIMYLTINFLLKSSSLKLLKVIRK